MEMKIVGVTLAAFVSLVVLAAVLVPILDDATTVNEMFTNVGYYDMSYTEDDAVSVAWDHTAPHQVTVNNEIVALPESPQNALTIVCGDGWLIRYTGTAFQLYLNASSNRSASVNDGTDATFVASGGSATFTSTAESNNTATVSYTSMYYVNSDGIYVMKQSDKPAYVKGDSLMYGQGRSYLNNVGGTVMLRVDGTIDDGVTVTNIYPNANYEFSDVTINKTPVTGFKDLYQVDTLTFTATNISTTATDDVTYSYFIVPAEVTAERSVHFTDNMNELLGVIPVLVIVAILLGVVALVIRSKLD